MHEKALLCLSALLAIPLLDVFGIISFRSVDGLLIAFLVSVSTLLLLAVAVLPGIESARQALPSHWLFAMDAWLATSVASFIIAWMIVPDTTVQIGLFDLSVVLWVSMSAIGAVATKALIGWIYYFFHDFETGTR